MSVPFEMRDAEAGPDAHVVAVRGEVDLFTAPEFKQRVSAPLEAGKRILVIDFSETTFVDSSTLGVLIAAHKHLARRDGSVVIVCQDKSILNTLKVTGLDGLFTVVATREDALAGIERSGAA